MYTYNYIYTDIYTKIYTFTFTLTYSLCYIYFHLHKHLHLHTEITFTFTILHLPEAHQIHVAFTSFVSTTCSADWKTPMQDSWLNARSSLAALGRKSWQKETESWQLAMAAAWKWAERGNDPSWSHSHRSGSRSVAVIFGATEPRCFMV